MHTLTLLVATFLSAAPADALEPWASKAHPQDVAKRHVQEITTGPQEYRITQGGTMDGENCRSPIGGGYAIWQQSWETNRAVRMENIGPTDVVNPWLSNGRKDFRSIERIVAGALRPGMTEREKALALWRLQTTHRFHASSGDNEVNDPVKVLNVYGYTTCGNDSICLAGLWKTAGFKVQPVHCVGHCISQVYYDGGWHAMDADQGPVYLLRDNTTIASEQDLVRDHDLLKRAHTAGILDPDNRSADERMAGIFVYEGQATATRNSVRDTTMNLVLRPNEAIVWRWGHLTPTKYHGRLDIKLWGPRKDGDKVWGGHGVDHICNGLWEYRPDFASDTWRKGVETVEGVRVENGSLVAEPGKTGQVIWRMRSPYPFVGGRLETEGSGATFYLSFNGQPWEEITDNLEAFFHFPYKGDARYEYRLKCELSGDARLKRLVIANDLQMAPLALPGMVVGENKFVYTDESQGSRQIRITHEWVERSLSSPPSAPPSPVSPADRGLTDRTDIVFQWDLPRETKDPIADYHFELSDRPDMAWPLSSNFEKLISNTADSGHARYTLPSAGLLNPGERYYWHVRAKNDKNVWGPWSETWSFVTGGLACPINVRLDEYLVLRWSSNPVGWKPVKYRVYGSDEKGFSIEAKLLIGETTDTEWMVPVVAARSNPKAYYRVVAVDAAERQSGPSDYAAAPRPWIDVDIRVRARVGEPFRGELKTIRSIGDLRHRTVEGRTVVKYWDEERPAFKLVKGPAWLRVDETTGVLSGQPTAAGMAEVEVAVTLTRPLYKLDDQRLIWGHEKVLETGTETVGTATQRFQIIVSP